MAPSAISAEQPAGNVDEGKPKSQDDSAIEHVHDGEELTPLQAISHNWDSGGVIMGGTQQESLYTNYLLTSLSRHPQIPHLPS